MKAASGWVMRLLPQSGALFQSHRGGLCLPPPPPPSPHPHCSLLSARREPRLLQWMKLPWSWGSWDISDNQSPETNAALTGSLSPACLEEGWDVRGSSPSPLGTVVDHVQAVSRRAQLLAASRGKPSVAGPRVLGAQRPGPCPSRTCHVAARLRRFVFSPGNAASPSTGHTASGKTFLTSLARVIFFPLNFHITLEVINT